MRSSQLLTVILVLACCGCDQKPKAGAGPDAAAAVVARPAVAMTGAMAKIVGAWTEEKEFGESEPKPESKRPGLVIKDDGTMRFTYPASDLSPTTGEAGKPTHSDFKYTVAESRDNSVLMKMQIVLGDSTMAGDDKRFTLVDDDTLKEEGVSEGKETGLGGLFKRVGPNAKTPGP